MVCSGPGLSSQNALPTDGSGTIRITGRDLWVAGSATNVTIGGVSSGVIIDPSRVVLGNLPTSARLLADATMQYIDVTLPSWQGVNVPVVVFKQTGVSASGIGTATGTVVERVLLVGGVHLSAASLASSRTVIPHSCAPCAITVAHPLPLYLAVSRCLCLPLSLFRSVSVSLCLSISLTHSLSSSLFLSLRHRRQVLTRCTCRSTHRRRPLLSAPAAWCDPVTSRPATPLRSSPPAPTARPPSSWSASTSALASRSSRSPLARRQVRRRPDPRGACSARTARGRRRRSSASCRLGWAAWTRSLASPCTCTRCSLVQCATP